MKDIQKELETTDQALKQYIVIRFNKEQFGISINYIQNIHYSGSECSRLY